MLTKVYQSVPGLPGAIIHMSEGADMPQAVLTESMLSALHTLGTRLSILSISDQPKIKPRSASVPGRRRWWSPHATLS